MAAGPRAAPSPAPAFVFPDKPLGPAGQLNLSSAPFKITFPRLILCLQP